MNSLRMSFWIVPESSACETPCSSAGDDVRGEHREHGAVHRHGHRDLVQRDVREEQLHVLHGVHGDARHADVAGHARVVGVVAPVRSEVEGHRDAASPGRERLAVERVRLLRRGEPGVLADRPRAPGVHGRVRPSEERLEARQRVRVRQTLDVPGRVERFDRQTVGSGADEPFDGSAERRLSGVLPVGQIVRRTDARAGSVVRGLCALLVCHRNSMTRWPTATLSPGSTRSRSITQSWSALSTFSIFIASITRSGSPTLTA